MFNINEEGLLKTFSNYLKSKNLRHTAERTAIFDKICKTKGFFSPDTILQQLEDENFHVSRASIYNTTELLLDAQIVVRHQFTSSIIQYELKCIAERYHYSVCTQCGSVSRIKNEHLNNNFINYKIPKFTSQYYALYIYGICSKCKYKLMREEIRNNKNSKN